MLYTVNLSFFNQELFYKYTNPLKCNESVYIRQVSLFFNKHFITDFAITRLNLFPVITDLSRLTSPISISMKFMMFVIRR